MSQEEFYNLQSKHRGKKTFNFYDKFVPQPFKVTPSPSVSVTPTLTPSITPSITQSVTPTPSPFYGYGFKITNGIESWMNGIWTLSPYDRFYDEVRGSSGGFAYSGFFCITPDPTSNPYGNVWRKVGTTDTLIHCEVFIRDGETSGSPKLRLKKGGITDQIPSDPNTPYSCNFRMFDSVSDFSAIYDGEATVYCNRGYPTEGSNTFGDVEWLSYCPDITPSITPTTSITPSITPTTSINPSITPTPTITPSITPTPTITPSSCYVEEVCVSIGDVTPSLAEFDGTYYPWELGTLEYVSDSGGIYTLEVKCSDNTQMYTGTTTGGTQAVLYRSNVGSNPWVVVKLVSGTLTCNTQITTSAPVGNNGDFNCGVEIVPSNSIAWIDYGACT